MGHCQCTRPNVPCVSGSTVSLHCSLLYVLFYEQINGMEWNGMDKPKMRENITAVGEVTLHAFISNWAINICNRASVAIENFFEKVRGIL